MKTVTSKHILSLYLLFTSNPEGACRGCWCNLPNASGDTKAACHGLFVLLLVKADPPYPSVSDTQRVNE